ncbi:MAG: hypothetical protein AAF371_13730 [Pseudomonadota bacterium]
MSFEGSAVGVFSAEFSDGFVFTAEVAGGAGVELGSHLGPSRPGLALDLAGDRLVLTAEAARAYPSERRLALEDVSGGLRAMRGADIGANTVEAFGEADIEVSADRLALDFGGIRFDTGDGIRVAFATAEARTIALLYEAAFDRDGQVDAPGLGFRIDRRGCGVRIPGPTARRG